MLRSNSKQSGGIHVVSPEEENERLWWEGFAEKEGVHGTEVLGHMEIMKLLIEHHADVNAGTTGKSITVLHLRLEKDTKLDNADVNILDAGGKKPTDVAHHSAIAKLLQ